MEEISTGMEALTKAVEGKGFKVERKVFMILNLSDSNQKSINLMLSSEPSVDQDTRRQQG